MYLMSHKLVVVCIWVVIILHFSSELKSAGAWDWGGGVGGTRPMYYEKE